MEAFSELRSILLTGFNEECDRYEARAATSFPEAQLREQARLQQEKINKLEEEVTRLRGRLTRAAQRSGSSGSLHAVSRVKDAKTSSSFAPVQNVVQYGARNDSTSRLSKSSSDLRSPQESTTRKEEKEVAALSAIVAEYRVRIIDLQRTLNISKTITKAIAGDAQFLCDFIEEPSKNTSEKPSREQEQELLIQRQERRIARRQREYAKVIEANVILLQKNRELRNLAKAWAKFDAMITSRSAQSAGFERSSLLSPGHQLASRISPDNPAANALDQAKQYLDQAMEASALTDQEKGPALMDTSLSPLGNSSAALFVSPKRITSLRLVRKELESRVEEITSSHAPSKYADSTAAFSTTAEADSVGDEVEFVSERSLKRKRHGTGNALLLEEGAQQPAGIKGEPDSNQYATQSMLDKIYNSDSLDLDAIGRHANTPKRRRVRHNLTESPIDGEKAGLVCSTSSTSNERPSRLLSCRDFLALYMVLQRGEAFLDSNDADNLEDAILKGMDGRLGDLEAPHLITMLVRHPGRLPKGPFGKLSRKDERPLQAGSPVLQPIAPNFQIRSSVMDSTSKRGGVQVECEERLRANAISVVAEDGENQMQRLSTTTRAQKSTQHIKAAPPETLHSRLNAILSRSPAVPPRLSTPARPKFLSKQKPVLGNFKPQGQSYHTGTSRPTATGVSHDIGKLAPVSRPTPPPQAKPWQRPSNETFAREPRLSTHTSGTRPEGKPLRSCSLEGLVTSDFIINPIANQGLDYAFTDVVRKRADRKCLPNCTKPECCGTAFQKLVSIAGFQPALSTNLGALTPESARSADNRLLRTYLGDQAHTLQLMTPAEKQTLRQTAQAEQMAQRFGKHRHTHQRAASPPGFWRTDMPDTQEEEQDRRAARRAEREKVLARYREAMRPGGRWKFRDE